MMDITKSTVRQHISALRSGEYSSLTLTRAYLDKIEKDDLNTFLYVDRKGAEEAAKRADEMLKSPDAHPLCGIPFAAKDNICTRGIPTTAGSRMLESFVPPYSATVIKRLESFGAVLLGKTNMDEFGMGSATSNSAFAVTKNPWDTRRTPGGSSGGSAAAVAKGLVPFALGSDTGGSVRQPAAFCGCVGLCPTYGALSRYGLIAFASSLDRIGILSRDCLDSALIFSSLLGKDPRDATSLDHKTSETPEKTIKTLRIGIAKELSESNAAPEIKAAIEGCAKALEAMGAEVLSVSLPSLQYAAEAYYVISSAEASSNLARYDGVRFGKRTDESTVSIEDFYKENRTEGLGDEVKRRILLGIFALCEGSYDKLYQKAVAVRELICKDYEKAFRCCDLILSPVSPVTAPFLDEAVTDPTEIYARDICTVSQSLARLPAVSLPFGNDENGLPIGIQLTAPALCEDLLLGVGETLREVTK